MGDFDFDVNLAGRRDQGLTENERLEVVDKAGK